MTEKPILDPKIAEDYFYAKSFDFSYSSLNKLLYSPMLFYKHYILGEREEELEKHLVEGRVIHKLLFDVDTFDEEFVIGMEKVPSDNVVDVIKTINNIRKQEAESLPEDMGCRTNLDEFESEILTALADKNLYQKMSDELKLKRIINTEGIEYFNFLKKVEGKTMISADTYSDCVEKVVKIQNHECMKNMGLHHQNESMSDVYNELDIQMTMDEEGFPFGIKGFIDNLFIDRPKKTIRINDLKTTSKTISEFTDAVSLYNYWIQAAIYERLVRKILKDKYADWDYVFSYIVIDKYSQVYQFEVSQDTMTEWQIDLQEKLHEAKFHYERRDYSLPYKFLTSKVKL
jgi:hypothetical protein